MQCPMRYFDWLKTFYISFLSVKSKMGPNVHVFRRTALRRARMAASIAPLPMIGPFILPRKRCNSILPHQSFEKFNHVLPVSLVVLK